MTQTVGISLSVDLCQCKKQLISELVTRFDVTIQPVNESMIKVVCIDTSSQFTSVLIALPEPIFDFEP